MLISEIIEELQDLRSEYAHIASQFNEVENDYSSRTLPFLSDEWSDFVYDKTSIQLENGDWVSPYSYDEDDEEEVKQVEAIRQNPELFAEYEENFKTYISSKLTEEEADKLVKKAIKVINKVSDLAREHGLGDIGFESDIFLGLDSVHYESSRCW